jgi:hypothetical protein
MNHITALLAPSPSFSPSGPVKWRSEARARRVSTRHAAPLTLTNGLEALGGTIEPTPRREEPVVTGSSLTSYPYLATYKVVRNAG